ncbi:hypothetical protein OSTOST_14984, partial [Ostertagia ostertagi]
VKIPIAIVVVVQDNSNKEQYQQAQDTISCYATYHGYPFHYVIVADNTTLTEICPQKDFMFQRHCVVAHMMSLWDEQWLLFIDADMAIINPNHLIEEYIPSDPEVHIVFYNRIFNHEVMAGSYLTRNSQLLLQFLIALEQLRIHNLQSFHGSDNGAVHSAIVSYEVPVEDGARKGCEKFWSSAKDYDTLSIYEGSSSWARDGWLTNSAWSEQDFILHGWQRRRKDKMRFARWHSPLVDATWNSALCAGPNAYFNWRYKDSFIEKNEEIQRRLNVTIRQVEADFQSIKATIQTTR